MAFTISIPLKNQVDTNRRLSMDNPNRQYTWTVHAFRYEFISTDNNIVNSNANSKPVILKDSSIRFIWTCLTASRCYATNTNKHGYSTNTNTHTHTHTHTHTQTETETETETDRQTDRQTETDRQRQTETDRERQRQRGRDRERQRNRQTDRQIDR